MVTEPVSHVMLEGSIFPEGHLGEPSPRLSHRGERSVLQSGLRGAGRRSPSREAGSGIADRRGASGAGRGRGTGPRLRPPNRCSTTSRDSRTKHLSRLRGRPGRLLHADLYE